MKTILNIFFTTFKLYIRLLAHSTLVYNSGDDFDLDTSPHGQFAHLKRGSCRKILAEKLLVHFVDAGKVVDVIQHNGALNHVLVGGSCLLQNVANCSQGLSSLGADAPRHQFHIFVHSQNPR